MKELLKLLFLAFLPYAGVAALCLNEIDKSKEFKQRNEEQLRKYNQELMEKTQVLDYIKK